MRWEDESGETMEEPQAGSGSVRHVVRPREGAVPGEDGCWADGDWEEVAVWRPWTDAELAERAAQEARASAPDAVSALASAADPSDPVGSLGRVGRALRWLMGSLDSVPDEVASACSALVPPWAPGEDVAAGQLRAHGGSLWRCVQGHATQAGWEPGLAPALWSEVSYGASGAQEWTAPTGAHDAPMAGDLRSHGGRVWESLINGNTTEPGTPGGARWWRDVTKNA